MIPNAISWREALPSTPPWRSTWPNLGDVVDWHFVWHSTFINELADSFADSLESLVGPSGRISDIFPNLHPDASIPVGILNAKFDRFLASSGFTNLGDLLDLPTTRFRTNDTVTQLEILILCQIEAKANGVSRVSDTELVDSELESRIEAKRESISELLQDFILDLSDTQRNVLAGRVTPGASRTLDSIGQDLGLTRERIRQIEAGIHQEFEQYLNKQAPLAKALSQIRSMCLEPRTFADIAELYPWTKVPVINTVSALDLIAGLNYLISRNGWYATNFDEVEATFLTAISGLEDQRLLHQDQLYGCLSAVWPSMARESLNQWMKDHGYELLLGYWVRNPKLADFACIALHTNGSPLTVDEIVSRFDFEINTRTLDAAMVTSSLFTKSGKNHWALSTWGLPEYRPIQEAIGEMIDREGSLPLDLIVARLLPTGVQESSIRTYASNPPFIVTDGMVRRSGRRKVVRKTVEQSKNLYHHKEGLVYRVKLNSEHFRGSGFACPAALAAFLGVTSGHDVILKSDHGDFKVSLRGAMFHLPSIRKAAQALNCKVDDEITILLSQSRVEFHRVNNEGDKLSRIFSAIGLQSESLDLQQALSFALSRHTLHAKDKVLELLRLRRELDLADLVQDAI